MERREESKTEVEPVALVTVASPADFDAQLASSLESASGPVYAMFFGTIKPETGESWCPDCVSAGPCVKAALAKFHEASPGAVLLWCLVERSEYKGVPDYPYRTHPKIMLNSIPTLVRFTSGGDAGGKWQDDELQETDRIVAALSS